MPVSTRPTRGPFPPGGDIATGDFALRPWRASDANSLVDAYASLDVPPAWEPRTAPLTLADARRFLAKSRRGWRNGLAASFAIERLDGSCAGAISVRLVAPRIARVGYWLVPAERGKGLMARALAALIEWSFRVTDLEELELDVKPTNGASIHVAEKTGFTRAGVGEEVIAGQWRNVVTMRLPRAAATNSPEPVALRAVSRHPRPLVTVDACVFGVAPDGLKVLLIRRRRRPFRNALALPGGFVEFEEEPAHAAARELAEETSVAGVDLVPFANFGAVGRDPRGWTISLAHLGVVHADDVTPHGGDDARGAAWRNLRNLPRLAADHSEIVATAAAALGKNRPPFPVDGELPAARPNLLLVAGLTGAGKSTFSRALSAALPELVHIDTDMLRRDLTHDRPHFGEQEAWWVHNSARALAEWMLRSGHDVVVDATGLTASDRAHYLSSAALFGARSMLIWCEAPEDEAVRRILNRKGWSRSVRGRSGLRFRLRSMARLERPRLDEAEQVEQVRPDTAAHVLERLTAQLSGPRSLRAAA